MAREAAIHATLRHRSIVAFRGVRDGALLLEHAPLGDLRYFLRRRDDVGLRGRLRMLYHVVQALAYVHRQGLIHRDVKPDNVLVCRRRQAKLADFGTAARASVAPRDFSGTLEYIAPEVHAGRAQTASADVWSLGVVLHELLCGATPFAGLRREQIRARLAGWKPDRDIAVGVDVDADARELLAALLQLEPAERPTCEQVLRCRLFAQFRRRDERDLPVFDLSSAKSQGADDCGGEEAVPLSLALQPSALVVNSAVVTSTRKMDFLDATKGPRPASPAVVVLPRKRVDDLLERDNSTFSHERSCHTPDKQPGKLLFETPARDKLAAAGTALPKRFERRVLGEDVASCDSVELAQPTSLLSLARVVLTPPRKLAQL